MSNVDIGRYSKRLVQLFWDPAPKNDDTSQASIWCLGRCYNPRAELSSSLKPPEQHFTPVVQTSETSSPDVKTVERAGSESSFENVVEQGTPVANNGEEWPVAFLDDFESRIWLTYRSNFHPIPKSPDPKASTMMSLSVRLKVQLSNQEGFTSDSGWGCMIRSGQSLVANALVLLRLGREWRRKQGDSMEKEIISYFADDPQAPFSIHKFVDRGASICGTYPGQWFGPSATAKCIEALSNDFAAAGLKVYVTGDGPDVFEDVLYRISKGSGSVFQPTLLLVGTRLGIDRVTPVYWNALKASLQLPQAVGIAGGRPSSSHYFVGVQGSSFFYLDPHQTRTALSFPDNVADYTAEEIDSCHTRRLRRISVEEMDPSMLIAFLFRDEADWKAWRQSVSQAPGKAIFHVGDHEIVGYGSGKERDAAVDEVETLDTDIDDGNDAE